MTELRPIDARTIRARSCPGTVRVEGIHVNHILGAGVTDIPVRGVPFTAYALREALHTAENWVGDLIDLAVIDAEGTSAGHHAPLLVLAAPGGADGERRCVVLAGRIDNDDRRTARDAIEVAE